MTHHGRRTPSAWSSARQAFGTVAYGFWPARPTPREVAATGVHSHDERIHIDDLGYATSFQIDACRVVGALR